MHVGAIVMPDSKNDAVVKTKVEARQGVAVPGMRHVLSFGLAGAVVALAIVILVMFG